MIQLNGASNADIWIRTIVYFNYGINIETEWASENKQKTPNLITFCPMVDRNSWFSDSLMLIIVVHFMCTKIWPTLKLSLSCAHKPQYHVCNRPSIIYIYISSVEVRALTTLTILSIPPIPTLFSIDFYCPCMWFDAFLLYIFLVVYTCVPLLTSSYFYMSHVPFE